MADIITGTTTGFVNNTQDAILQGVSDVRREGTEHFANVQLENMKGFDRVNSDVLKSAWSTTDAVKDQAHDVMNRSNDHAENLTNQATAYYIATQKNATDTQVIAATTAARNEADTIALQNAIAASASQVAAANALAAATNAAATQLEAAKNQAANALGQSLITQSISVDGEKTRALINDHRFQDLNRMLIERNAEIVEERGDARRWRGAADQSQFQVLASQLQAFQSNLSHQIATQGTVNFGTMSGNAGRNTSTNNIV